MFVVTVLKTLPGGGGGGTLGNYGWGCAAGTIYGSTPPPPSRGRYINPIGTLIV